ncbi:MAG: triose-phosphate isomerase [Patescibacteria group bacterium]|nr:triose-phosphate isomerase [Patescibacteria group bacterium]
MFKTFINFKTHPQGTGEKAVKLAQICREVQEGSSYAKATEDKQGIKIIPIVQAVDLYRVKQAIKIPIWVENVDPQPPGQATGWTALESVIEAGASGTLINHSEHQVPPGTIKQTIARSKEDKFETMICCRTLGQMERLVKLKPDFIGYEMSQFIGTKNSITDENPKAIKHAVEICQEIPLIVGSGIHKAEDLLKAKELGATGVLISSAVVLAEDPKNMLLGLLKLFK